MGVRLVVHNFLVDEANYTGTHNHDETIHRDWADQHPIYAITGLQEVLNTIEALLFDANELIIQKEIDCNQYADNAVAAESAIINNRIDNLNVMEDFLDTNTIDMVYDVKNSLLSANVRIYNDPDGTNAIQESDIGLYVPKLSTKDTNSISWSSTHRSRNIQELFEKGIRFSHYDLVDTNVSQPDEILGWSYDSTTQSIIQSLNTISYNGIISSDLHDDYKHSVRISSSDSDDAANGVIIGFVFDEYGKPHTLSCMIQRSGNMYLNYHCAIIYDFQLPEQTLVDTYNLVNSENGWNNNNISLYISKNQNLIKVSISNWNYNNTATNINQAASMTFAHTFSIDLDTYSWGYHFRDKVRYGYSNLSQPDSIFDKSLFTSVHHSSPMDTIANVKISSAANNSISINNDGLYSKRFLISPDANNGISEHANGYYVQAVHISDQRLNGFQDTGNGYYYVHKSHSFITVNQANHGFIVGDFIYFDNRTNLYQKALAKDDFDINIVGMISYADEINSFEYVCSGFVETDLFTSTNGYVQGMPLYISAVEAGKVTQNQPDISKAVGYPIENKGLIISIERGIQYNQEANIGDFKLSTNTYNIRSDGFIRVVSGVNYKQTLISPLINTVSQEFKDDYMDFNVELGTMSFKNVSTLKELNGCPTNVELFIKSF